MGLAKEGEAEKMAKMCREYEVYTLSDMLMPDGKELRQEAQSGGRWRSTCEGREWLKMIEDGAGMGRGAYSRLRARGGWRKARCDGETGSEAAGWWRGHRRRTGCGGGGWGGSGQ